MHRAPTSYAHMTRPDAVLLDLDGTLVDSEPIWIRAEQDLAASHGASWSYQQGVAQVGKHVSDTAFELRAAGVRLTVEDIVQTLTERVLADLSRPRWRPGVQVFLRSLAEARMPCAIVTSSPRPIAEAVVAAGPQRLFTHVISSADVVNPKPHPEPYRLAMHLLGVEADRAIAIEDSPFGISSAHAAGVKVVAIPSMSEIDPTSVWMHWSSFVGRSVLDLAL